MEKSPNSKKSPEKKSGEVDQKKLSATQSAMKWLKDNWRKSTILGVGAIMAAPGVAQDANKQATREFTDSKGNTVEIAIKNKKGETKKQDYQATAEDFENAAKDSKTKESKKERVKPQQEIDLTWPSLDPELVEKYGIYYDEIGRVLNEDGTTYKGEYGAPFIGGATKEKVAVVNNGPRKLKPGYKFGPNNVVLDSKGNPATENPFADGEVKEVKNQENVYAQTNNAPMNKKGPKLKPGYKFGPNNVVVDSKGNPATEDPFVRK